MNKKKANILCLIVSLLAAIGSIVYLCLMIAYATGPLWTLILCIICHGLLIMWDTSFAYDSLLNLLDGDENNEEK